MLKCWQRYVFKGVLSYVFRSVLLCGWPMMYGHRMTGTVQRPLIYLISDGRRCIKLCKVWLAGDNLQIPSVHCRHPFSAYHFCQMEYIKLDLYGSARWTILVHAMMPSGQNSHFIFIGKLRAEPPPPSMLNPP